MITEDKIKKYASTVLVSTVESLFNHDKTAIDNFYKEFVKDNKRNKKLKDNQKDNEVIDELILEELEKSFTQNDIGRVLQTEMVRENDKAIEELANVLDEKLKPIESQLIQWFDNTEQYNQFRKYTTEGLVVSNLNLKMSVVKALKTLNISGMQSAQIMQLISTVDD
ncbi:MAG: hypothetical protein BZ137_09530 [Methanosphaera sp. rholeuAM130]|nr:MAG: hypothetical protein BZ137_09530 [Methanosphaera sp. rholeuAM130]